MKQWLKTISIQGGFFPSDRVERCQFWMEFKEDKAGV